MSWHSQADVWNVGALTVCDGPPSPAESKSLDGKGDHRMISGQQSEGERQGCFGKGRW